ncbi:YdeI/OmpD-associated family protein [Ornithinimicrobium humiphilum]|uniref:Uncharacterized protein YdeI (YjbR/CyaY-like superfamily) n=1 Tax=Ornithinimicrobium humiphilum TaxID=125288 RepID=A0A543KK71_9MICO|nr:YdeI/OmpD-associated family protein [Ornithinimicrobium humiphilum]TQM95482.1 uncharacterized protein YdeI (YjbR/CyaY-like superfamily) [Ornithinimicrobium humiphilum]
MTVGWVEGGTPERPAIFFSGPDAFRAWLEEHHATADELWMGLWKKHVPVRGLTWEEAVPVALCFGWIDSVSQRIDDDARRQRWTPRRPGSRWSAVNVAHVERLQAQGLMRPEGLVVFEARRERTGYSYGPEELAPDELAALEAVPAAAAFWAAATAGYRRVVAVWLHDAKQETTRQRRLQQLVQDSAAGQLVPPQRYGEVPAWVARAAAAAREAGGSG